MATKLSTLDLLQKAYFGIEFETCVSNATRDITSLEDYVEELKKISQQKGIIMPVDFSYDPRTTNYEAWRATLDASVTCNDTTAIYIHEETGKPYFSVELVSPLTSYDKKDLHQFFQFYRNVILDENFSYEVNQSQGMHVNVSHQYCQADDDKLKVLKAWWYFEPVIFEFVPPKRRNSIYAVKLRETFVSYGDMVRTWKEFFKNPDSPPAKYRALGVKSNRFEFRIIPASMNFVNVCAWLTFCVRFITASLTQNLDFIDQAESSEKKSMDEDEDEDEDEDSVSGNSFTEAKFDELFRFIAMGDNISRLKCYFKQTCIRMFSNTEDFEDDCPEDAKTKFNVEDWQRALETENIKMLNFLHHMNPEVKVIPTAPEKILGKQKLFEYLQDEHLSIDWSKSQRKIIGNEEELKIFHQFFPDVSYHNLISTFFLFDIVSNQRFHLLKDLISNMGYNTTIYDIQLMKSAMENFKKVKIDIQKFYQNAFINFVNENDLALAEKFLETVSEMDISSLMSSVDKKALKSVLRMRLNDPTEISKRLKDFLKGLAKALNDEDLKRELKARFASQVESSTGEGEGVN